MLRWIVTGVLVIIAGLVWIALKGKIEPTYSIVYRPVNWLWLGGSKWHHVFNVLVNTLIVVGIFVFYKYPLNAGNVFSMAVAILAAAGVSGGKEKLDRYVQLDDVAFCGIGILIGVSVILFCLW